MEQPKINQPPVPENKKQEPSLSLFKKLARDLVTIEDADEIVEFINSRELKRSKQIGEPVNQDNIITVQEAKNYFNGETNANADQLANERVARLISGLGISSLG